MLTRQIAMLLVAGAAMAFNDPAAAQGKVVVYSANDANLNRFVFEAFTKETGIQVEQVEAGSGVIFRRIASEKDRPLGDAVWGVSRILLQTNKSLLAPYASKNKDAVPAQFRSLVPKATTPAKSSSEAAAASQEGACQPVAAASEPARRPALATVGDSADGREKSPAIKSPVI